MQERISYEGCPLCASRKIIDYVTADCSQHPLYDPALSNVINWMRCQDCSHVFTEGYYTEEACRIVFSKTNASQQVGYELEKGRVVSARMVEKVLPYASSGVWLDVGFGNGALLFTAQEYGFTPVGSDLRAENVKALEVLGIKALCKDVADITLDQECAVVSMADVLEHIPYPGPALAAVRRLMATDGILLLSMPNIDSTVWRLMTEAHTNPFWGELEHFHNFGRGRLYSLLQENGFTPLRYGISERYRACMEVVAQKRGS